MPVTRDWLLGQRACPSDYAAFRREFGEEAAITRENFERARALGLNLLWLGCHMLDRARRQVLVRHTLALRRAALNALLGREAPTDATALNEEADEALQGWAAGGDLRLRGLAVAMRDAARDGALTEPSPYEGYEAALAALRAISCAGGDQAAAHAGLEDWLADRVIGDQT